MKIYKIICFLVIMGGLAYVNDIIGLKHNKSVQHDGLKVPLAEQSKGKISEASTVFKDLMQDQSKRILLGSTMDLSRMNKDMSENIKLGIELALSEKISKDKEIQFTVLDDMYMPEKARENVLQLINEYGCQFLISIPFAGGFYRYLDIIKEGKIAVLMPVSGVPFKRTAELALKYCIYYRPSWYDETAIMTRHCMESNPSKVIVFSPDDIVGQAGIDAVRSVIGNKARIIEVTYKRNDTNFENQVKVIEKESPDYVLLGALPTAAMELIRQIDRVLLLKIKFYGSSSLLTKTFEKFAKEKNLDIRIMCPVPDPVNSSVPIAVKFRALAQEKNIAPTALTFEGYVTTSFLLHLFDHFEGPITKESVIAALENVKNFDFQGIKLNFDPIKRQLSNTLWIAQDGTQWKELTIESVS